MRHGLGVPGFCAVVSVLAGCATQPLQNLPVSNDAIVAFSLNGRVAVKLEDRGTPAACAGAIPQHKTRSGCFLRSAPSWARSRLMLGGLRSPQAIKKSIDLMTRSP